MPDFITSAAPELPFILILLALLGFRWRVNPRVSVFVRAPMERIFPLVDFIEGDMQRWQRTRVHCGLVDAESQTYRLTFVTPLATGAVQSSNALFRVMRREFPRLLEVDRAGLEGKSENNQLLKIHATLAPEGNGTRLTLAHFWGPRPLLAQLLARTDLWGSIYRLKGVAETGKPDFMTDSLISMCVAVVTGLITLATFSFAFNWIVAVLLLAALFIHEYGHLLAYRLIGQPWGRMVFLPFLGGIAVPRIGFTTQGQTVFSALMGPGFSAIFAVIVTLIVWLDPGPSRDVWVAVGLVICGLNLFNMLPVEPLDGGLVLRYVLSSLLGRFSNVGHLLIGAAIIAAGFYLQQVLFVIFGLLAVIVNLRPRTIDPGIEPLSRLQVVISAFAFMSIVAAYAVQIRYLMEKANL
jgi:Zn-dependent protease